MRKVTNVNKTDGQALPYTRYSLYTFTFESGTSTTLKLTRSMYKVTYAQAVWSVIKKCVSQDGEFNFFALKTFKPRDMQEAQSIADGYGIEVDNMASDLCEREALANEIFGRDAYSFARQGKKGLKHCVVMPWSEGTILGDFINQPESQLADNVLKILTSLFKQFEMLHTAGYIHGNIHIDNAMINRESLEVTLIDSCTVRKPMSGQRSYNMTNRAYLEPSFKDCHHNQLDEAFTFEHEVYSIGKVANAMLRCIGHKSGLESLTDLINRMMNDDSMARPSMSECVEIIDKIHVVNEETIMPESPRSTDTIGPRREWK